MSASGVVSTVKDRGAAEVYRKMWEVLKIVLKSELKIRVSFWRCPIRK